MEPTVRNNGAPDWKLPPDLGECVAGLMNAVATGISDLVAPHDLIPMEFALLRLFLRREEWTTTQLAQVLPVKLSRISRDRDQAGRQGPDSQAASCASDRRVVILTLTEEGRALTLELHRRAQAHDARLSEGVTEQELAALAAATSKITANYAALPTPIHSPGEPSTSSHDPGTIQL